MRLLVVRLSGKQSEAEKFQTRLQKLPKSRGDNTKSKYEAILWKLEIACIFKERRFH